MGQPHCYGKMTWILKYPKEDIPNQGICNCCYKDKCLEITLNPRIKERDIYISVADNVLSAIAILNTAECTCTEDDVLNCNKCGTLEDLKVIYSDVKKTIKSFK